LGVNYLIVHKRDTDPTEILPFEEFDQANTLYDKLQENWTETYLCSVMKGPGRTSYFSSEKKFRMVVGALDAAFNGDCSTEKLEQLAKDFLEHLEGVHGWAVMPPCK
jgi:hypothetical protein